MVAAHYRSAGCPGFRGLGLPGVGVLGLGASASVFEERGLTLQGETVVGGDSPGVDQAVERAGRDVLVDGGIEDAIGEERREGLGEVGRARLGELGEVEHVGLGAEAAGVVVEGGDADVVGGEVELRVEVAIGGRIAVDDGLIETAAEVEGSFSKRVERDSMVGMVGAALDMEDSFSGCGRS